MVAYPEKTATPYTKILVMFPHIVYTLPDGLVQPYRIMGGSEREKWSAKRMAVVGDARMHALVRCAEKPYPMLKDIDQWTTSDLARVQFMYGVQTFIDTGSWKEIREKFGVGPEVCSMWPAYLAPGFGPSTAECHQVVAGYVYVDLETKEQHVVGMDGGWDLNWGSKYLHVCRGVRNINSGRVSAWCMSLLMRGTPHSVYNIHTIGEPTIEGGHDKLLERLLDGVGLQYLRNVENANEVLRGDPIAVHDMIVTSEILQEAYAGPTIHLGGKDVPPITIRYQVEATLNPRTAWIELYKAGMVSDMEIGDDAKRALFQVFPSDGINFLDVPGQG